MRPKWEDALLHAFGPPAWATVPLCVQQMPSYVFCTSLYVELGDQLLRVQASGLRILLWEGALP